jgi:hypothetical protein
MSADTPKRTQESDVDADRPMDDLNPSAVDAKSAEDVRGGTTSTGKVSTHDIPITKHVDP